MQSGARARAHTGSSEGAVGVGCSGAGRKCAPHVRRSWLRIDERNTHHVGLGRAARVVRALLAQGPDALRPAVVRYAGRGAHTRPRVDHRVLSSPQQLRQAHHLLLQHLRVILDLRRVRLLLQLSRRRTVHGTLVAGCRLRMRTEQRGLLSRPRSFGSLQSLLKLARQLSLGLRRLQPCRGVGCAASHGHVAQRHLFLAGRTPVISSEQTYLSPWTIFHAHFTRTLKNRYTLRANRTRAEPRAALRRLPRVVGGPNGDGGAACPPRNRLLNSAGGLHASPQARELGCGCHAGRVHGLPELGAHQRNLSCLASHTHVTSYGRR